MACCAIGGSEYVTVTELKKLCAAMHKEIDSKILALETEIEKQIAALDTDRIAALEQKIMSLKVIVESFDISQKVQDERLDKLEAISANTEIKVEEVTDLWEGN